MCNLEIMDWLDTISELEKECFEIPYTLEILKNCFESDHYNFFLLFLIDKKTFVCSLSKHEIQLLDSNILEGEKNLSLPRIFKEFSKKYLLGYAIFLRLADFSAELLRVGIKKDFQNQGLGVAFLDKIIQYYFSKKEINRIYLEVSEQNRKAIYLYKKLGFQVYAVRKKYYNNQTHAYCMLLEKNSTI